MAFQPGAVVRLKSGGPQMTVVQKGAGRASGINPDAYKCRWFQQDGKLIEDYFLEAELEAVVPGAVAAPGAPSKRWP